MAVRRADDLDRTMINDVTAGVVRSFIDLGAGAGGQSARLVAAGASVCAVDVVDYTQAFNQLRYQLGCSEKTLRFMCEDITHFVPTIPAQRYDGVCLQRALHYLPYQTAAEILTTLARQVTGRLYVSVTGHGSAIGQAHPQRAQAIQDRFAPLPPAAAEIFSLQAPLLVYTEVELRMLLEHSGWTIVRQWNSAFGNIKVVAIS